MNSPSHRPSDRYLKGIETTAAKVPNFAIRTDQNMHNTNQTGQAIFCPSCKIRSPNRTWTRAPAEPLASREPGTATHQEHMRITKYYSQTLHGTAIYTLTPKTTPTDQHIWQSHGVSGIVFQQWFWNLASSCLTDAFRGVQECPGDCACQTGSCLPLPYLGTMEHASQGGISRVVLSHVSTSSFMHHHTRSSLTATWFGTTVGTSGN